MLKFKQIAQKYRETEHLKIFLLFGLILLICLSYISAKIWDQIHLESPTTYGVTYSPDYATALGLDSKKTYLQMFQDLKIKKIRLPAYWDKIEPKPDEFNFKDLDFYIDNATKNNAQIILAIGYKLPRWPECRVPVWLENSSNENRQTQQLIYLQKVIEHYASNPAIFAWQIENEPLLSFGTCNLVDEQFLRKEVAFVRSITKKPLILTDSGELSSWITPMQLADIFGTTIYRTVQIPLLGDVPYPLQPWFYRIKSSLIRTFWAPHNKTTINVELQTEPWAEIFIADIPINKQLEHFTLQDLKNNVNFAKKVGTPEIYLWGVEWWYWIKDHGHPEFLEFAKTLFH